VIATSLLVELDEPNRVQLMWVLRHGVIDGNETRDQLVKLGVEYQLLEPEPTKQAARNWTIRDSRQHRDSLYVLKKAKSLIHGSSESKTRELLKLSRSQP
jgi:NRPS condensation-like uncharacterized protein